ncbi:hypothetical protein KPH14_001497 [Odynerus spinipes]|uniref:Uncharacterized protein n=1 Tax=Odynerus spinipes TaxID=1348599 RepID=A0AAD9RV78_9HYME|nr:hypothetical protein KPH14_001497 [Odynerus spinipes]
MDFRSTHQRGGPYARHGVLFFKEKQENGGSTPLGALSIRTDYKYTFGPTRQRYGRSPEKDDARQRFLAISTENDEKILRDTREESRAPRAIPYTSKDASA